MKSYMVYAYAPVNVRVRAKNAAEAARIGLEALDRTRPLTLSDDDDSQAMYLDSGVPCMADKEHAPALLDKDSKHLDHVEE